MPHTPGPWTYDVSGGHPLLGYDICEVPSGGRGQFANEDDARLCSAAPDLLAACQFMMRKVEDVRTEMRAAGQVTTNQDEAEVAMIQAAIDKATN